MGYCPRTDGVSDRGLLNAAFAWTNERSYEIMQVSASGFSLRCKASLFNEEKLKAYMEDV